MQANIIKPTRDGNPFYFLILNYHILVSIFSKAQEAGELILLKLCSTQDTNAHYM